MTIDARENTALPLGPCGAPRQRAREFTLVAALVLAPWTTAAGATYSAATVAVGTNPTALAVNTTTNKIYVVYQGSN
jgi:hypothetical protein